MVAQSEYHEVSAAQRPARHNAKAELSRLRALVTHAPIGATAPLASIGFALKRQNHDG